MKKDTQAIFWEYTKAIATALLLALFIRAYFVQAFKIPSGSMIPTLLIGD
ncbi:MAG TPA: S26 family signal peptidase, partial [Thermodesulfovibrionales bacterium]|nr:S26 family signal peptidase [Thermodesulfovibrionales bacterium]